MTTPTLTPAPPTPGTVRGHHGQYVNSNAGVLGDHILGAIDEALEDIVAPAPTVIHVPAPPATVVHVDSHGYHDHGYFGESGGTLLAFLLAMLVFGLVYVSDLVWGSEAGWRCALWGVIAGATTGALCLAVVGNHHRRYR